MATLQQLEEGIRRAHEAGNAEHVRALGQAYRQMQQQQTPASEAPAAGPPEGAVPGSRGYADWAASEARAGRDLPQVSDPHFGEPESSILDPFVQGTTFGFADELAGAARGVRAASQGMDFGEAYNIGVDQSRRALDRERRVNPIGAVAAEVAGAIPTGIGLGGQLAGRGTSALLRLGSNVGVGTAQGAVYGAGASDGDLGERAKDSVAGAAVGGAAGAVVPAVVGAVRSVVANPTRQAVQAAPDAAAIKAAGQAGYDTANAAGVQIKPQASSILAHDFNQFLQTEGVLLPNGKLPDGMGKLKKALAQLQQYTQAPMTMPQFQRLREAVQEVARSPKSGQARIGSMMLDQLDGFVENLPDTAFIGQGGEGAAAAWSGAKKDWARYQRTKAIEDVMYNARMSPSGDYATRLRSAVGTLLKKHHKRGQGFSPDEVAGMEKFVEGGAVGDLFRSLAQGGGLPAGLMGGVTAGPVGAAAGAGASLGSRLWLDRAARNATEEIRAGIATPGGLNVSTGPGEMELFLARLGLGGAQPTLDNPRDAVSGLLLGR